LGRKSAAPAHQSAGKCSWRILEEMSRRAIEMLRDEPNRDTETPRSAEM
jgi:hypothetical protein